MRYILILITLLASSSFLSAKERPPELKNVDYFDVNLGTGTWYEIARITHWFQKGLVCAQAEYNVLDNGKLSVINTARKGFGGKLDASRYKAKVSDKLTNTRLTVTYFWPFHADFDIIDLGKNYEYAVVGEPKRNYLWILARTPRLEPEVYEGILERLKEQCYDVEKIELTPQE